MSYEPSRRRPRVEQLDADPTDRDRGSVLPMILALMVVGSLAVVALLTFATTLFTNRPPIEVRDRTFWSAKSAMSMAMVEQTAYGPEGCYKASDVMRINGYDAQVTCTPVSIVNDARGRFGVITTSNVATVSQFTGNGQGAAIKSVTGPVFVNGGNADATSRDLLVSGALQLSNFVSAATSAERYQNNAALPTPVAASCADPTAAGQVSSSFADPVPTAACEASAWWQSAGDQENAGDPYLYPTLPPLPLYTRTSTAQAQIPATGSNRCNVYFPGQYDAPLTLGAGRHYFASGVYYFNSTITVQPGAVVVAGEGRSPGCAVDAEAAFAPAGPKAHSITGKGATFLLGGAGRLVSNGSITINRRVSDSSTRGSDGVAIRSVNFRPAVPATPQPVEIPNDAVIIADVFDSTNAACDPALSTTQCLQKAATHTAQATKTAPVRSYLSSTLGVVDAILQVDQRTGNASANQFVADGYVFVPNARVTLQGGTNTNYRMRITGGLVASGVSAAYQSLPVGNDNWFLGVSSKPKLAEVSLIATVSDPNGQKSISRATLQVNEGRLYAIKGWTVDPNAQTPTPTTSPATTTTAPPATTVETTIPTTTTTTTPPATTTTTTLPPTTTTTVPVCRPAQTTWTGQYWNDSSASDRLQGPPDRTRQDSQIDFDWKDDEPMSGIDEDNFSIRWTRDVRIAAAGNYEFTMRGDDGMRLFINGTQVSPVGAWKDQAATTYQFSVPLTACTHAMVFEFYEKGGQASAALSWARVS